MTAFNSTHMTGRLQTRSCMYEKVYKFTMEKWSSIPLKHFIMISVKSILHLRLFCRILQIFPKTRKMLLITQLLYFITFSDIMHYKTLCSFWFLSQQFFQKGEFMVTLVSTFFLKLNLNYLVYKLFSFFRVRFHFVSLKLCFSSGQSFYFFSW